MYKCMSLKKEEYKWSTKVWELKSSRNKLSWLPRLCEHCGCVHPADILTLLLDEGWDIQATSDINVSALVPAALRCFDLKKLQKLSPQEIYIKIPDYPNPELIIHAHHLSNKLLFRIHEIHTYGLTIQ